MPFESLCPYSVGRSRKLSSSGWKPPHRRPRLPAVPPLLNTIIGRAPINTRPHSAYVTALMVGHRNGPNEASVLNLFLLSLQHFWAINCYHQRLMYLVQTTIQTQEMPLNPLRGISNSWGQLKSVLTCR